MSLPIIRVHWLNESRAFRVLWLLDHLKLDYEIVPYKRTEGFRAPDELKKVHPLGRAPIVTIEDKTTKKTKTLAESGFIFHQILQNFDKSNILNNPNPDAADQIEYYLYYAEGSLQPPLMIEFLLSMVNKAPIPFPLSYLAGKVSNKISEKYSRGEVKNQMDFVEGEISKNNGYLVDGRLSGADILLSFPLQIAFQRGFAQAEHYPNIDKWLKKITAEESYAIAKQRAAEYGGKF
ncbi:LAFA_0B00276g1_1 [Lachancea sp. 'fantastica']|nr:LAFA_0B00276g1_1 [Lachancea sp. 'fantastica']